jgi:hypothetical protein
MNNVPSASDSAAVYALSLMTWRFVVCKDKEFFLTSDDPVFILSGIKNPESEVSFPISKSIALWATWRQDLEEGFFEATRQVVKEINRRTISNALNFVYTPEKASWINKILSKKNIRLSRIV